MPKGIAPEWLWEFRPFRALSVEEVKLLKSPGRLPGSRVVALPLTFPSGYCRTVAGVLHAGEGGLADDSGGTAADSHGLSYYPPGGGGHRGD